MKNINKFRLDLSPWKTIKLDSKMIRADNTLLISKIFHSRKTFIIGWCFKSLSSNTMSEGNRRIVEFLKFYTSTLKHHGPVFLVKLLKEFSVSLQKISGNDFSYPVNPRFSTKKGLPYFISRLDRENLLKGDVKLLQFYLTLFGVYRILSISSEFKLKTITSPFTGTTKVAPVPIVQDFGAYLLSLNSGKRYSVNRADFRLLPIWKSSPFGSVSFSHALRATYLLPFQPWAEKFLDLHMKDNIFVSASLESLRMAILALPNFLHLLNVRMWRISTDLNDSDPSVPFGWLSCKVEAAGKIRVFAMVDYLSQVLLKPFHDYLFGLLSKMSTDGTFNQGATVRRIRETRTGHCFSFDLSAATDRLPVDLQVQILSELASPEYAAAWKEFLVGRQYWFYPSRDQLRFKSDLPLKGLNRYLYAVGQPMGALSSWASLAVTHHFMICWACHRAGIAYRGFLDYAVLGDDMCIWNSKVAREYLVIAKMLGVEINLSKSILSYQRRLPNGKLSDTAVEFAKRTLRGRIDISPLPFKLLLGGREMIPALFHLLMEIGDMEVSRTLLVLSYPFASRLKLTYRQNKNPIGSLNQELGRKLLYVLGQMVQNNYLSLREYLELIFEASGKPKVTKYLLLLRLLRSTPNKSERLEAFYRSPKTFAILRGLVKGFEQYLDRSMKSISLEKGLASLDYQWGKLLLGPSFRQVIDGDWVLLSDFQRSFYLDLIKSGAAECSASLFSSLPLRKEVAESSRQVVDRGYHSRPPAFFGDVGMPTSIPLIQTLLHSILSRMFLPVTFYRRPQDEFSDKLLASKSKDLFIIYSDLSQLWETYYGSFADGVIPPLEDLMSMIEEIEMLRICNSPGFLDLDRLEDDNRDLFRGFRVNHPILRMIQSGLPRSKSAPLKT